MIQREDPISEQTIIQSKAHIPGPTVGVSQIPRDDADEEGGDSEKEIEHLTLVQEDTAQPSSLAHTRAPDRLDRLIERVEELHVILAPYQPLHVSNSPTLKAKSLLSRLKLMT